MYYAPYALLDRPVATYGSYYSILYNQDIIKNEFKRKQLEIAKGIMK